MGLPTECSVDTAQTRDETARWDDLRRFIFAMRRRVARGADEYKDESFTRPPGNLITEVQEELEDVAVWAWILWCRLEDLRPKVNNLTANRLPDDESHPRV